MEYLWQDRTRFSAHKVPALRTSMQLGHSLDLLKWMRGVLRALAVMQTIRAVHGDLKLSNVMTLPNGEAVLIDFDCAVIVERGEVNMMSDGGTSEFTAQEAFDSSMEGREGRISPASDAFAFTVMTGDLIDSNVAWIFAAVAPELSQMLPHGLAYHPDARPTLHHFADAFETAEQSMRRFAPGGSCSIQDLVNMFSTESAVASYHEFVDLHTFVKVARLDLVPAVQEQSFPWGWDVRSAWLAYNAVGLDSSQLFQFIYSIKLKLWTWDTEGMLAELRASLDDMDRAMWTVRDWNSADGIRGSLQQAADADPMRFDAMYDEAVTQGQ